MAVNKIIKKTVAEPIRKYLISAVCWEPFPSQWEVGSAQLLVM